MKLLSKLIFVGVLAAGGAAMVGCADTYGSHNGYNSRHYQNGRGANDYDRDDPRFRGHDSDYGDYGTNWTWRGSARYCQAPDGSFQQCGPRR